MEPVDRHCRVGRHRRRVEQGARRRRRVERAAQHQRVLVGTLGALDHEQVRAGDGQRQGGGQARERGKALVPATPDGPGFERLAGALVVEGDPLGDLGGLTVLQPPIRVGHRDAVIDVGLVAAPGGGRRGYR